MLNSEITDQLATDILEKLIASRKMQLNNTPVFLKDERDNLEMEIGGYMRHLHKIQEAQNE